MNKIECCLRQKVGSCGGCNVLSIAEQVRLKTPRDGLPEAIRKIERDYCPDGETLILPEKPGQSIW